MRGLITHDMRHLFTIAFVLLALPSAALASTFHGTITADASPSVPAIVITAPTANPVAGTYTSAQSVMLSADCASSIRYTVDGSTPSCSGEGNSTVFSSPIDVSSSLTIQAISCYSGGDSSSVASFAYIISIPASAPTGGGGGGNGPIAGSLPLPNNATGGGGTDITPPTIVPPQTPVIATDIPPSSGNGNDTGSGTVAGASTTSVRGESDTVPVEKIATSSQAAAVASAGGEGYDFWWMLLLLLLFLLGDAWWVYNSRNFPQQS